MSELVLGSWLMDLSGEDVGWLEDLGSAYRLFYAEHRLGVADSRVLLRPMDDGFAEAGWRPLCSPSSSLSLFKAEGSYLAVQFAEGSSEPMAVAVSDELFRDTLLWFDAALTRDKASRQQLAIATFLCTVYPFFMHYVAGQGLGLLLHTAAVRIGGRMWLFAGRSGIGKSTFSRLWTGQDAGQIINDDRALVRPDAKGTGFTAYSVPWIGEDRIMLNENAPLAGICFLQQSATSEVCPLSPQQALRQLFPVASIPWYEKAFVGPALEVCDRLLSSVPAYELHFRPDQTAVDAVLALAT